MTVLEMSSPRYDIYRLNASELQYELAIRGVTNLTTVHPMRKALNTLLKLEREGNPVDYPGYPFPFTDDVAALQETIGDIRQVLEAFDGNDQRDLLNLGQRLLSLLGVLIEVNLPRMRSDP